MHGILGKECEFKHPKVCRRLLNHGIRGEKGCKLGSKCTMFHPTICRNSIKKNMCLSESCKYLHIKGTKRRRETPAPQEPSPSHRQYARKTPQSPSLPEPTLAPSNDHFLEALTSMRSDIGTLCRAMETQTLLLTSLVKDTNNKVGWPAPPPGPPPGQNPMGLGAIPRH